MVHSQSPPQAPESRYVMTLTSSLLGALCLFAQPLSELGARGPPVIWPEQNPLTLSHSTVWPKNNFAFTVTTSSCRLGWQDLSLTDSPFCSSQNSFFSCLHSFLSLALASWSSLLVFFATPFLLNYSEHVYLKISFTSHSKHFPPKCIL